MGRGGTHRLSAGGGASHFIALQPRRRARVPLAALCTLARLAILVCTGDALLGCGPSHARYREVVLREVDVIATFEHVVRHPRHDPPVLSASFWSTGLHGAIVPVLAVQAGKCYTRIHAGSCLFSPGLHAGVQHARAAEPRKKHALTQTRPRRARSLMGRLAGRGQRRTPMGSGGPAGAGSGVASPTRSSRRRLRPGKP